MKLENEWYLQLLLYTFLFAFVPWLPCLWLHLSLQWSPYLQESKYWPGKENLSKLCLKYLFYIVTNNLSHWPFKSLKAAIISYHECHVWHCYVHSTSNTSRSLCYTVSTMMTSIILSTRKRGQKTENKKQLWASRDSEMTEGSPSQLFCRDLMEMLQHFVQKKIG